MSSPGTATPPSPDKANAAPFLKSLEFPLTIAVAAGAVGCLITLVGSSQQFLAAYLTAYTAVTALALGCLFLTILHHLVDAGWSTVIRRPIEQVTSIFPWLAVAFIPLAIGIAAGRLHPWVTAEKSARAEQDEVYTAIVKDLNDRKVALDDLPKVPAFKDDKDDHKREEVLGIAAARLLNHTPSQVTIRTKTPPFRGDLVLTEDQSAELKAKGEVALTGLQVRAKINDTVEDIHKIHKKHGYLNLPFQFVRIAIYFGIWIVLSRFFRGNSLAQDTDGDPERSLRMRRRAPICVILFGLSLTFFAFDMLMALDFKWFSTIFGVYVFAGGVQAAFALCIIFAVTMASGPLKGVVPVDRLHDMGKMTFGFSVFWAYIAFSQFFLIWYANVPEETIWFRKRWEGDWVFLTSVMPVLRFALPFLILLPAFNKRNPKVALPVACLVLLAHALDHYWLAMPTFKPEKLLAGTLVGDISAFLLLGGGAAYLVVQALASAPIWPLRDPRLHEAIAEPHAYGTGHGHGSHGHAAATAH